MLKDEQDDFAYRILHNTVERLIKHLQLKLLKTHLEALINGNTVTLTPPLRELRALLKQESNYLWILQELKQQETDGVLIFCRAYYQYHRYMPNQPSLGAVRPAVDDVINEVWVELRGSHLRKTS